MPVLAAQVEAADFGTKGTWRHSCPTEMIMAFFVATAEAISIGVDLERFKTWALTAPCKFIAGRGDRAGHRMEMPTGP